MDQLAEEELVGLKLNSASSPYNKLRPDEYITEKDEGARKEFDSSLRLPRPTSLGSCALVEPINEFLIHWQAFSCVKMVIH